MASVEGWVCPECGLDYDTVKPLDTIRAVRSFPYRYRTLFKELFAHRADADSLMRTRPEPGRWSALEYAGHAADAIDSMAPEIRRIVVEDNPSLPAFDQEAKVESEGYNQQAPNEVLARLESACADMGMTLDCLGAEEWARTGTYPWGERDALTVARNAVHEGSHHLRDIEQNLTNLGVTWEDEEEN